jgi:serine/threonine-protein kinase RsbW
MHSVTLSARNTFEDLARIQREAERLLAQHGADQDVGHRVRLAIEELVSNVIRHAYEDTRPHDIRVTVDITHDAIALVIDDDGRPFDPSGRGELPTPASLHDAPTSGMGLALVEQMAGPIRYERKDDRNRVTVTIPRDGG